MFRKFIQSYCDTGGHIIMCCEFACNNVKVGRKKYLRRKVKRGGKIRSYETYNINILFSTYVRKMF